MLSITPEASKFIFQTIQNSIQAAGYAGILGYTNPRAAAVGTLAARVASTIFDGFAKVVFSKDANMPTTLLVFAGGMGVATLAGTFVGQKVDRTFSYPEMIALQVSAVVTFVLLSAVLGIIKINN